MKHGTQPIPGGSAPVDSELLERPYEAPALFVFEEVELGGGYHTLSTCHADKERDWSEPYKKTSAVQYRNRVVRVPYPPTVSGSNPKEG